MDIGVVLVDRYRLDQRFSAETSAQGFLWKGSDTLAGDTPVVLRQVDDPQSRDRLRRVWPQLQSASHPQLPRFGELFEAEGHLWTVRDWQEGVGFDQILSQRSERQMVFGAGEVLMLLRQLLPALTVLHGRGLVHGDINPGNLLRRNLDGLPVLVDFGLVQAIGEAPLTGATAGYAPRAQGRQESSQVWMDLHGLGVMALVLLSGRAPENLIDRDGEHWTWPEALELDAGFREVLERLISEDPDRRLASASDAIKALESVPMLDSTGPTARSDRTLVLAPTAPDLPLVQPQATASSSASSSSSAQGQPQRLSRAEERERGAEGRLWPVVAALALSALVGTAIGWYLLSRDASRGAAPSTSRDVVGRSPAVSLPPAEVDERQQLLSRLRALQVERTWFLKLVDSSLLSRFPERGGRLPTDSIEDAPLRRVWNDLAEEWLARIEQLPPTMRSRLGQLKEADWSQQQQALFKQGIHPRVVEQLVSAGARNLLPGDSQGRKPAEPYRQLWYAAAELSLADVGIERMTARSLKPSNLSLRVPAGGARLISVTVPSGYGLVLGINGTPLMQMTIYGADGQVEEERGPLRIVTLPAAIGSPVQVLVTNEGVASGLLTLSCRADRVKRPVVRDPLPPNVVPSPLRQPDVPTPADPIPDSATGEMPPSEGSVNPDPQLPSDEEDEWLTDS